MYGGTTDNSNTTEINGKNYLWNGKPGFVTLAAGEELILHVNSKFRETIISGSVDHASKITNLNYFR
jgi:hypothetical protein